MADKTISRFKFITGYLGGVVNSVCYGLGSASSQALKGVVPDCQLSVYRYIGQLLVFLPLAKALGTSLRVERKDIPYVFYSAMLAMLFTIGLFGCTGYLPLLEAISITCVATITAVTIHSKLVFKKEITLLHVISFLLCTLGIILVCQPPWLFLTDVNEKHYHSMFITQNSSLYGSNLLRYRDKNNAPILKVPEQRSKVVLYTLLILAGIGDGVNFDVNAVYLVDVPPITTAVYGSLVGLICSLLLSLYLENIYLDFTLKQIGLVLGHVACSPPVFFTTVYTSNAIGGIRASLIFSLQIVVMLVLQYTVMSSIMPGHHNWMETFGAIIILFAVILHPTFDLIKSHYQADIIP